MRALKKLWLTLFAVSSVCAVSAAQAAPGNTKLLTDYGMGAMIGGGVVGFTESAATDMTDPGGSWTARFIFGTRTPIGFEAAYVGTAQRISALNLDGKAALLSSAVEGALRLNLLTGDWQPYVFAGLAYKRYNLINSDSNTSSVKNQDDVGEVPLGLGLAWRYEGFVVDARFAINTAFDSNLLPNGTGGDTSLTNWNTNLRLGWEF